MRLINVCFLLVIIGITIMIAYNISNLALGTVSYCSVVYFILSSQLVFCSSLCFSPKTCAFCIVLLKSCIARRAQHFSKSFTKNTHFLPFSQRPFSPPPPVGSMSLRCNIHTANITIQGKTRSVYPNSPIKPLNHGA